MGIFCCSDGRQENHPLHTLSSGLARTMAEFFIPCFISRTRSFKPTFPAPQRSAPQYGLISSPPWKSLFYPLPQHSSAATDQSEARHAAPGGQGANGATAARWSDGGAQHQQAPAERNQLNLDSLQHARRSCFVPIRI